jgi:hypothetical protein
MAARFASINEHPIGEAERHFRWPRWVAAATTIQASATSASNASLADASAISTRRRKVICHD